MRKPDIEAFIEQANLHHPTIKNTADTFDTETTLLDTVVYKGTRFKGKSILDAKTHFKQTEASCAYISPCVTFFLVEIFEKVSFDPYNFRITRLSARRSEQTKNFLGIKVRLYLLFKY